MTPEAAARMARYNSWMNQRLYDLAARMTPAELQAERGAFFGSVLATFNHISVGDTLWLHRFARHPLGFATLTELSSQRAPGSLREPLAADLAGLWVRRQALDALIERWAAELTGAHLAAALSYTNMAGVAARKNFGALVQHFFNHQTHHRGQLTTLLFQAGLDPGVTDLLALIADEPT